MRFGFLKKNSTLNGGSDFESNHPILLFLICIATGVVSVLLTAGFIHLNSILRKFIYFSRSTNFSIIFQGRLFYTPILFFTLGGLIIGSILYFFLPRHGVAHGFPYLQDCYKKRKPISFKEIFFSTVASLLTISLGASIGREAPLMFLAGAVAIAFCKKFNFTKHYYRVIVASAVATTLSASLHSTFVGIFFVLEALPFSLKPRDLLPISLSVFTGLLFRELLPNVLPPVFWEYKTLAHVHHFGHYIVLGLLLGVAVILFIQPIKATLSWHLKSSIPRWIWPTIAGFILGIIAIFAPDVLGLSFDFVRQAEHWKAIPSVQLILLFILFKYIATYFSIAFGFSGGIITPTFILGLFLGVLYSIGLHHIFPDLPIEYHLYAIAASAIFTGASIGAPLSFTFLCYEMTQNLSFATHLFVGMMCTLLIMKFFNVSSFYQKQRSLYFSSHDPF